MGCSTNSLDFVIRLLSAPPECHIYLMYTKEFKYLVCLLMFVPFINILTDKDINDWDLDLIGITYHFLC